MIVLYMVHFIITSKKLPARFFEGDNGREPVREWLLDLKEEDRKVIGNDICTAELGWPIGMPLCRSISSHKGLWEVRTNLSNGRIAKVFFCAHKEKMILLHGMIKKNRNMSQTLRSNE